MVAIMNKLSTQHSTTPALGPGSAPRRARTQTNVQSLLYLPTSKFMERESFRYIGPKKIPKNCATIAAMGKGCPFRHGSISAKEWHRDRRRSYMEGHPERIAAANERAKNSRKKNPWAGPLYEKRSTYRGEFSISNNTARSMWLRDRGYCLSRPTLVRADPLLGWTPENCCYVEAGTVKPGRKKKRLDTETR